MKKYILFCFMVFLTCPAWSGQNGVLSLDPQVSRIKAAVGRKTARYVTVRNCGSEPVNVTVQPEEWSSDNEVLNAQVGWLKVSPAVFKLKPGHSRRVKVTVKPGAEQSGEKYTQIFFACKKDTKSALGIGVRISSLIYWNFGT